MILKEIGILILINSEMPFNKKISSGDEICIWYGMYIIEEFS
ncbi:hypothetical protein SAMN05421594_3444 [Chryseobacterium oleae]|uniref:Uncharacterized protein n=1 Tax=Chryseobacterium oleae TaxID=491207 RepID=A0A1I5AA18_CHROL|nr:hypothetical protein SAMN05421594_3444 [Chryseobacterium oleae]